MKYAIIDIETTGGNKITEVAVFIHDGTQIIDEFTSLVDPECHIPAYITKLTGISNSTVRGAPKFYEIARQLVELTKDTVFVAHNVNFDYGIIQKEFAALGATFKRKKLCTVRLSRKLIPGLKSYSLGKLCASQGIPLEDRHRARGDAAATVILFEKLLQLDTEGVFDAFLKGNSRQGTLPPLLPKEVFDGLPEKEGVYYFRNAQNEVIYVGKANNIKQRVASHIYDKAKREVTLCMETANITYTETGSELLALLLESAEIKRIYPKFNRAQRRTGENIGLFSYEDRNGILHIAFNKLRLVNKPILKFYNATEARLFVEKLCETFELCPKYCHLQSNVSACFHYQIKQCKGICKGQESISDYNRRVREALDSVRFQAESFVILEKGVQTEEQAFVLVVNNVYKGFGYTPKKEALPTIADYMPYLNPQQDNRDIHRILNSFLKKNPERILPVSGSFETEFRLF